MALFGSPEKKCILCGKNPGEDKHPAADNRFLCDKCAMECGYENAFFADVLPEDLTPERVARDHEQFEIRLEENKSMYKAFRSTVRFDKFLSLDQEQLLLCAPDTLMPDSRTPIVYKYSQIIDCRVLLTENDQVRTIATTEEDVDFDDEETIAFFSNLPVAEDLKVQILTRDAMHPLITIRMMENELRKSSRKFKQICEVATDLFFSVKTIIDNNRAVR